MSKFLGIFFAVVLLFPVTNSYAQIKVMDDNPPAQGMQLHADPRLAIVLKKHTTGTGVGVISSGRGFRVQIYSGNDRNKATATKIDFMRRFPRCAYLYDLCIAAVQGKGGRFPLSCRSI